MVKVCFTCAERKMCLLLINGTSSKMKFSIKCFSSKYDQICRKLRIFTAQKMKFSIKDFFSKCEQIRSFLRNNSHLLKKSLLANFIFCAVLVTFNKEILSEKTHFLCSVRMLLFLFSHILPQLYRVQLVKPKRSVSKHLC